MGTNMESAYVWGALGVCMLLGGLVCLGIYVHLGDQHVLKALCGLGNLCLGIWVFEELCGLGESACIVDFMFWGILYVGSTCMFLGLHMF